MIGNVENIENDFVAKMPMGNSVLNEVLADLSKTQKSLPTKLLYDKRGSEIFEKICLLKEYYPTRAETEILKTYAHEISDLIGREALIIEPGSGAGDKIRYLLPHLVNPIGYVPIEISRDILLRMKEELNEEFPSLDVMPLCTDFNQEIILPHQLDSRPYKKVVFFPGSTIGNFGQQEAVQFMKRMGRMIGPGGGLVIGVDLKKKSEVLKSAYDDPHGVTAAFNLNLLERLNREMDANFNTANFKHEAFYNESLGRVEMHLVSKMAQLIKVNDTVFQFKEGETIHTESSYKYNVDEFSGLCAKAKFKLKSTWKDSQKLFCVYYFEWDSSNV